MKILYALTMPWQVLIIAIDYACIFYKAGEQ